MATAEVDICNDALLILGSSTISSMAGTSKEAILCNRAYALARDQLLSAHPWNFAIVRAEIASDASLPTGWDDGTWAYAFTIPSNTLRVLGIDDTNEDWAQEGGKIFANYTPIFIKAIKKVTDTTIFSKHFEKALAYEMAVKMCYALDQSPQALAVITKLRDEAVAEARSFDGQEGSSPMVEASDFINSRY